MFVVPPRPFGVVAPHPQQQMPPQFMGGHGGHTGHGGHGGHGGPMPPPPQMPQMSMKHPADEGDEPAAKKMRTEESLIPENTFLAKNKVIFILKCFSLGAVL